VTELPAYDQLVQLAHATTDPEARALIMAELAFIGPYVNHDTDVHNTLAAAVLEKIRQHAAAT
jgi:hypothetical protein